MMNRPVLTNVQHMYRDIHKDEDGYKQQVARWTGRILAREPVVPEGYRFVWSRGDQSASNTAHLYDAVMCNLQYAQQKIHCSGSMIGKKAYTGAMDAAKTLSYVLTDLLPRWNFRPQEISNLPDTRESDIYGHYCLARAIAYDNVGKADLVCTANAHIVATSNAAHLYTVAAQLIDGDPSHMIRRAQICTAKALEEWGGVYLERWDDDTDAEGAAKALACYTEAHEWYQRGGHIGCIDRVNFATERNQVHWLEPVLPPWTSLVRPRVTALT